MAQLTITVPDGVVSRIRDAFGMVDVLTLQRTPATIAELQAAIKGFIKQTVINYEAEQALRLKAEQGSKEEW